MIDLKGLLTLAMLCVLTSLPVNAIQSCNPTKPNIVLMLMDDMGWGDIGANGDPAHETVNLDRMAEEGLLLTDFYTANPLCSPSRASILTGRLPIRNGFYTNNIKARNAYLPQEVAGGISDKEILLPQILSKVGYRNKIVGKWHLGHAPQYLPTKHGFHEFFGSPHCHFGPYNDKNTPNIPVYRDDRMIGRYFENIHIDPKTQVSNLTQIFTEEAIQFIDKQAAACEPFFLYWTPDGLHAPTYRSTPYVGRSAKQSSYGDALIEMDEAVGRILDTIQSHDHLRNNTLVFFTSDNGAALVSGSDAGSNGPLLCGKQTTFEGGFREPAIAWWPTRIKAGTKSSQVSSVMDLFRTIANIADADMPIDRPYDSNDLTQVLFEQKLLPNASIFYYRGDTLMAIRHGPYKAHFWTFTNTWEEFRTGINYCPGSELANITTHELTEHKIPTLFHVVRDAGERFPIRSKSSEYKKAIETIENIRRQHEDGMKPGKPVLNMCDIAAMNWQPPGCEQLNMCLPKPKSEPKPCWWPH